MKLTINGKDCELKYGLSFIGEIDEMYKQKSNGMEIAVGLDMLALYMSTSNPVALRNAIQAGTSHMSGRPSQREINEYLEQVAEKDELDQLFEDVLNEMEVAPFLKKKFKDIKKEMEKKEDK